MPHSTPAVMLLWSILSTMELVFLLHHLWRYDRFSCLRWNSGRQPGAFKRIMTYSYLLSVPLLAFYSYTMSFIKYNEGYMDLTLFGQGVIPKPYALWPVKYQDLVLPATICFSVAWSLEIVSHLEELNFWLFLLHQGPSQRDWFSSMEFRTWAAGATLAVVGMPTLTVLTRADPYKCEAWTFFAGGVGSLLITLWFLVVLAKFPRFLKRVKQEGAEADVVVRLTTFDELNRIRVGFRFFFAAPLLVLAVDGVLGGKRPINSNPFWTDLLSIVAGISCVTSSILTLLIFFPRSIAKEAGYKAKTVSINSRQTGTMVTGGTPMSPSDDTYFENQSHTIGVAVSTDPAPMYQPTRSTTPNAGMALGRSYPYSHGGVGSGPAEWEMGEVQHQGDIEANWDGSPRNYIKMPSEQSLAHGDMPPYGDAKHVKTTNSRAPVRPPRPAEPVLHPLIMNYTSPIDLMDQATSSASRPRHPRHPRRL